MELRNYQQDALAAVEKYRLDGTTKQLIVLPTGTGKTVLFAHLPQTVPNPLPMLVLAHREELLVQAKAKIEAANPHLVVAIEQAENYAQGADVVVASVPTLGRADGRRIQRFDKNHFRTVVVDEAHHAAADSYRRILDYFDTDLRIGFTATPQRSDNTRLTDIFDEIVYFRTISDMITEAWLSPLIGYRLTTDVDLSNVRISHGDYAEGELARAINTDARNEAIVEGFERYAKERQTIVFCADVAHTESVAFEFVKRGYRAASVIGTTPAEERRGILRDFHEKKIQVITNCMVLTEGFDEPAVSAIIMARPTQSQLLYTQAVGRGTRRAPGKEDCLVLDIADATTGRRPVGLPSLMGLPPDFDTEGEPVHVVGEAYSSLGSSAPGEVISVRSLSDINAAWERIDLFALPTPDPVLLSLSSLVWTETAESQYRLGLGNGESVEITVDTLGRCVCLLHPSTDAQRAHDGGPAIPERLYVGDAEGESALRDAFSAADAWIRAQRPDQLRLLFSEAGWRTDPVTDKQRRALRRFSVPITADMTKGHASFILDKLFAANPKPSRPVWLQRKINGQRQGF